uniref:Retroelement n=1 Tax=Oryza sativa subsp. japonica TaxID=39947 RepID=Q8LM60_ORYSJ|nr:Putative retroelement [Oryza sativa Japonica Group]
MATPARFSTKNHVFDGTDFSHWCSRMQSYIMAEDYDIWRKVSHPYVIPEAINTAAEKTAFEQNCKARNILLSGISRSDYDRVTHFRTAHEIWNVLSNFHQGTNNIKELRRDIFKKEYIKFEMKPGEALNDYLSRFIKILSYLRSVDFSYDTNYPQSEISRHFLNGLDMSIWEMKVTSIQKSVNMSTLTLDSLYRKLKTHEMNVLSRKVDSKSSALVSSSSYSLDVDAFSSKPSFLAVFNVTSDDQLEQIEEEDLAFVANRILELRIMPGTGKELGRGKREDKDGEKTNNNKPKGSSQGRKLENLRKAFQQVSAAFEPQNDVDGESGDDDKGKNISDVCFVARGESDTEYEDNEVSAFEEAINVLSEKNKKCEKMYRKQEFIIESLKYEIARLKSLIPNDDDCSNCEVLMNEISKIRDLKQPHDVLDCSTCNLNKLKLKDALGRVEFMEDVVKNNEVLSCPKCRKSKGVMVDYANCANLEKEVSYLKNSLLRFSDGKKNLNMILDQSKVSTHNRGLGFNPYTHNSRHPPVVLGVGARSGEILVKPDTNKTVFKSAGIMSTLNASSSKSNVVHANSPVVACVAKSSNVSNVSNHREKYTCSFCGKDALVARKENVWIVDSGCSQHMTGDKNWFSSLKKASKTESIIFGDASTSAVLATGLVKVHFKKTGSKVFDSCGDSVLNISRYGRVFKADFENPVSPVITCLVANFDKDMMFWHRRLGHFGFDHLTMLSRLDLVRGLPKLMKDLDLVYTPCHHAKMVAYSHAPIVSMMTDAPGQLLHMDTVGPARVQSVGGKWYVLVIVDHFSRYSWVFFMATKDEAFQHFRGLFLRLDLEFPSSLKRIRSDNGGEFKNASFEQFSNERGLEHEFSSPRVPQQNGVVEWKNRVLVEKARTISKLGKTFYELRFGHQPKVSHLRVFGCKSIVLKSGNLDKFEARSTDGLFLGYPAHTRGYRVLILETNKIAETCKVSFDEACPGTRPDIAGTLSQVQGEDGRIFEDESNDNDDDEVSSAGQTAGTPPVRPAQEVRSDRPGSSAEDSVDAVRDGERTTRSKVTTHDVCANSAFVASFEPKDVSHALTDESWINTMHEELENFERNKVWTLVEPPSGHNIIGTKIEAIRLLLAFAASKGFKLYQMDVKSAFLNGFIQVEVYVKQPPCFENPDFPNHVIKLSKALYGLKQAPRAWYDRLKNFLLVKGFTMGKVDKTPFVLKHGDNQLFVQIYVNDIIFGCSTHALVVDFAETMHREFEMSMMGELSYFLGLQIKQTPQGTFVHQTKYTKDLLRRFKKENCKPISTPIGSTAVLDPDEDGEAIDQKEYRSMIGSLLYLTASRPDIQFAVCLCARFQASPRASHRQAVKIDRKSTSGTCHFLGTPLIAWSSRKQSSVAQSTAKSEYVTAASCCSQILWLLFTLKDYGLIFEKVPLFCDNTNAINVAKNRVQHSRTKHIDIRFHFLRDHVEKGDVELQFLDTKLQLADIFTKPLDSNRFAFLCGELGIIHPFGMV